MSGHRAGPLRWRFAGQLARVLPQTRGRDRLVVLARGRGEVVGRITGTLTNGLRFDFEDASDPALTALVHLQYTRPALAPILEACLFPGACFYDVGANMGLYSLWAADIVGPAGQVVAFEPAHASRILLDQFAALNRIQHIQVLPCAVGSYSGSAWLDSDPQGLAQASITAHRRSTSEQVAMVRLDDYLGKTPTPALVKIDVEGHELQVLEGGSRLWERLRPIIVFEAIPAQLERHDASYAEITQLLHLLDYRVYDLTSRGLKPSVVAQPTTNVIALCPDVGAHEELWERLVRTTFARNQTV